MNQSADGGVRLGSEADVRALSMMIFWMTVAAGAHAEAPPPVSYPALEDAVLAEINLLRKDPRGYADKLRTLRPSYHGNRILRGGDEPAIAVIEGVSALDEAIRVLEKAPRRLPRLGPSLGLERAARVHADDCNAHDLLGHDGSDGSSPDERVSRFGEWSGIVAENISFGPLDAEEIVIGLLVDDGVPDRGHRDVLLTRDLFFAGVACGPHPSYRIACVMDFATSLRPKSTRRQRSRPPTVPERTPLQLDYP